MKFDQREEEVSWRVDIERSQGRVISVVYWDAHTDEESAEAFETHTHQRTFWQGWMVDLFELSCTDARDRFLWRIYTHRRGVHRGLCLSLAATDEEARTHRAQNDSLWTVGSLGRDTTPPKTTAPTNDLTHLFVPHHAPPTQAPSTIPTAQTLFVRVDRPGDRFRLLVEDEDGGLFATVEPNKAPNAHTLTTWDSRPLASLYTLHRSPQGSEALLTHPPDLHEPLSHALAHALPCIASILVDA